MFGINKSLHVQCSKYNQKRSERNFRTFDRLPIYRQKVGSNIDFIPIRWSRVMKIEILIKCE